MSENGDYFIALIATICNVHSLCLYALAIVDFYSRLWQSTYKQTHKQISQLNMKGFVSKNVRVLNLEHKNIKTPNVWHFAIGGDEFNQCSTQAHIFKPIVDKLCRHRWVWQTYWAVCMLVEKYRSTGDDWCVSIEERKMGTLLLPDYCYVWYSHSST